MEDVPLTEWHGMFEDVYQIAVWEAKSHDHIRASLTETIREYILNVQQDLMSNQDESSLLKAYIVHWNKFANRSETLSLPFRSLKAMSGQQLVDLNRRSARDGSVKKIMLETWNTCIYEVLQQKLLDSAVKLIQSERCGQLIDSSLVIGISESCVILSGAQSTKKPKYVSQLEYAYIEGTKNFYRSRIAQFVQEHGIRSYTEYAGQKLVEEEARGRRYLETKTEYDSLSKLMDACGQLFVVDYMDQLLAEVPKLLREEDTTCLRRFYELIRRGPDGFDALLPLFEQYIKQTGLEDIRVNAETMLKDADKYVCRLLDLYFRFSRVAEEAFNNDPLLLSSRDKAYQEIVNNTLVLTTDVPASISNSGIRRVESRCPELLATYCDLLLRKSPTNRRLTPDEVEHQLKSVLLVLKYVNSKDIFMRVYKSHLMRRLILETSADNEMEEMMVDRLRDVGMSAEQVNKLGRMFQDIKLSHDFTVSFKEAYKSGSVNPTGQIAPNLNVDLVHILILSSGSWLLRSTQKVAICLPSELEDVLPMIEEFYRQKHFGRSLVWQHHLSHGIVSFTGDQGRFELELTTYQIIVLYAWNLRFDQGLTLDSLITATGLHETELRRTLWSLCAHPKMEQQLILYSPKVKSDKDFTEKTLFQLNLNFCNTRGGKTQARRRINLIGRLQLTQEQTNDDDSMAIVELRQLRAQEGIIKLMKTRKRLHHNDLYKELVDLLRYQFVPSKRLIKEVLEWLLERQYIRRDESDMNTFVYVT
ncbi:Cullin 5 [Fasciola hepatica]|uniref:Cullin-5 n=1 Tax=Fasciola hepatica TaxID=6192 RepID=A0A4E0S0J1_FASHE|nr:Cullin 5 [Fasciola hepatica]